MTVISSLAPGLGEGGVRGHGDAEAVRKVLEILAHLSDEHAIVLSICLVTNPAIPPKVSRGDHHLLLQVLPHSGLGLQRIVVVVLIKGWVIVVYCK